MANNAAPVAGIAAVEDTCRNTQGADWVEVEHVVVVAAAIDVDNDNHRSQTSRVVVVVAFLVNEILEDLMNEGNTADTSDCMNKSPA